MSFSKKKVYSKQKKDQAKIAGVIQMRAGWTHDARLRVAGEAGNKTKAIRETEIQTVTFLNKNKQRSASTITTWHLHKELAENESWK